MQQQKIIWFAIAFSTVIYAGVAFAIAGNPQGSFEESLRNPIVLFAYVGALGAFFAAMIVPRFAPPRSRMIVALAIAEASAVFGIMAAFIGHDYRLYFAPWALAVIGFLRVWPGGDVSAPSS